MGRESGFHRSKNDLSFFLVLDFKGVYGYETPVKRDGEKDDQKRNRVLRTLLGESPSIVADRKGLPLLFSIT